jgi:hypothetical protein
VLVECKLTFKRRETTVQDEFKIAKLALVENDGGELLRLSSEFGATRGIAGDEILEDTTYERSAKCSLFLHLRPGLYIPWGGLAMTKWSLGYRRKGKIGKKSEERWSEGAQDWFRKELGENKKLNTSNTQDPLTYGQKLSHARRRMTMRCLASHSSYETSTR